MWHERANSEVSFRGRDLIIGPVLEDIQVENYRREYEILLRSLNDLLQGNEAVL